MKGTTHFESMQAQAVALMRKLSHSVQSPAVCLTSCMLSSNNMKVTGTTHNWQHDQETCLSVAMILTSSFSQKSGRDINHITSCWFWVSIFFVPQCNYIPWKAVDTTTQSDFPWQSVIFNETRRVSWFVSA